MEERLKCPYCQGEMVSGQARIKGTVMDFLAVGWSSQQLWFRRSDKLKDERILSSWSEGKREGHQCTVCGAVLIKSKTDATQSDAAHEERLCTNCGCGISEDSKTCRWCGADQE